MYGKIEAVKSPHIPLSGRNSTTIVSGLEYLVGNIMNNLTKLSLVLIIHFLSFIFFALFPSSIVRSSPAIADINGDTYLDIMVGGDIGYIYAFNYDESIISPFPLPLFGQVTSPIIGDIDGDGESEIIVASSDGFLHVWENRSSEVSSYLLEWRQFHHDYQRTGKFGW